MTGKGVFFSISEAPSPMRRANRFPMGHLDAAEFSRNAMQREERGHYPSVMSVMREERGHYPSVMSVTNCDDPQPADTGSTGQGGDS